MIGLPRFKDLSLGFLGDKSVENKADVLQRVETS